VTHAGSSIRRGFVDRFATLWETDRSLTVLAGLLAVVIFAVAPFVDHATGGGLIFEAGFVLILLSGIAAVARTRAWFRLLGVLAVATFLVRLTATFLPHDLALIARPAISLAYCALLSLVVAERVFRVGPVTVHRVLGSVAVYLLFGMIWAQAYEIVVRLVPGSFAISPDSQVHEVGQVLYFSFATLTTVGYGDVTALHPVARSLALLEALVGQLFPAILIARLVGLSLQRVE
jgi:hypothetical protein